jgi:hypothetical protein
MILNLSILLPIYGTNRENGWATTTTTTTISDLSVLSITSFDTTLDKKVWAAFTFIVLNGLLSIALVYSFWKASLMLKCNSTYSQKRLSEKDVALHSVLVRNLARELNPHFA